MNTEISYAVNYLVDIIKERLYSASEEQLQALRKRLPELLYKKYENHWYSDKPMKGSAFRCINVSVEDTSVDAVLRQAAAECGITTKDLLKVFNKGLALWVDPNDVSCRLGKGAIFPVYKKIAESKKTRTESPPLVTGSKQHRPQQRPRSHSPPQMFNYQQSTSQLQTRPRSTTPPGFSSMDAGQMFQTLPNNRVRYSTENIHKLWDTIPNTTYATSSVHSTVSQASTPSYASSARSYDSSYSFNQYSSYYNPHTSHWKKNSRQQQRQQKPQWIDDEVYERYHWSRSDTSAMSVTGNNMTLSSMNQYGYTSARQAQEVC